MKAPGTSRGKVKLRVSKLLDAVQHGSTRYSPELALTSGWQLLAVDYTVRVVGTALSLRVTDAPVASGETFRVDDASITLLSVSANAVTSGDGTAVEPLAGADEIATPLAFSAAITPNPTRGGTRLSFVTTREGFARAALYDASGRRVRELINGQSLAPGRHRLDLDARNGRHAPLSSGIYFYRIEASEGVLGGRCVFIQ